MTKLQRAKRNTAPVEVMRLAELFSNYYSGKTNRGFLRLVCHIPELRKLAVRWAFSGKFGSIPLRQLQSEILVLGLLRSGQSGLSQEPHFHATCSFDTANQSMMIESIPIDAPDIVKMSRIVPIETATISFWSNLENAFAAGQIRKIIVKLLDPAPLAHGAFLELELSAISAFAKDWPSDVAYALRISTSPAYGGDHRVLQRILSRRSS